jgi:hypothetical protein
MEPIETITGPKGLYAHLYQDPDSGNPREDDNMGRLATVHLSRHQLMDVGEPALPEDLSGWEAVERYLMRERGAVVILPVYLYDHGGTAISTKSFIGRAHHAEWDSGQIGFIYATRQAILENFMVKRLAKGILKLAEENLAGEIETFNQWISGDVYSYQIIRESKCDACGHSEPDECVDACGGFYGYGYAKQEAEKALAAAAKEE